MSKSQLLCCFVYIVMRRRRCNRDLAKLVLEALNLKSETYSVLEKSSFLQQAVHRCNNHWRCWTNHHHPYLECHPPLTHRRIPPRRRLQYHYLLIFYEFSVQGGRSRYLPRISWSRRRACCSWLRLFRTFLSSLSFLSCTTKYR